MSSMTRAIPEWLLPVAKHVADNQTIGTLPGATSSQIEHGIADAARAHLHLDDDALVFYRFMNGTAYAGIAIAGLGLDESSDPLKRQDLSTLNTYHDDWRDSKTLYGYEGDMFFLFDPTDGRFKAWSAGDAFANFSTFAEMIQAVFSESNAAYDS